MATQRNIVLILGNGFDLDLGLKTSYKDFWESDYCPEIYPAPLIFHLNEKMRNDLTRVKWYDLENELLEYGLHGKKEDIISDNEKQYIRDHQDWSISNIIRYVGSDHVCESLLEKGIIRIREDQFHLQHIDVPYREDIQLNSISRDQRAFQLIKESLCNYLRSIENNIDPYRYNSPFQVFRTLVDGVDSNHTLNIYTFNYTSVPWGFSSEYQDIIHYVHGNYHDNNIIIGTRDESIEKEYDFLQKAFDKGFYPPPIVEDLDSADEVIIYGHSLGLNDRQYFKPFFTRQSGFDQSRKKNITIITKDDESEVEIKRSLQQLTDNQLSVLMSKNNVRFIKTDNLIEDASSFNDFLISHGTSRRDAMEIIGKIVEYKKTLMDNNQN